MSRQGVDDRVVARCWIQPVWLFGLPGRSTSSQRRPRGPVALADHGKHGPLAGDRPAVAELRQALGVRARRQEGTGVVVEDRELLCGRCAGRAGWS